jgi:hypothetical protein
MRFIAEEGEGRENRESGIRVAQYRAGSNAILAGCDDQQGWEE